MTSPIKFFTIALVISFFYFSKIYAQKAEEKSLLWEVSGNGLKQPSYLYGTFHMLCPNDFKIDESLKKKLENSGQLYLEIDFDDFAGMMKLQEMITFKDEKTIKDFLKAKDYEKLKQFFKDSLKTNLDQVGKSRPFFLQALIYQKMMKCPVVVPEMVFMSEILKQKKEVKGLEPVEAQMHVVEELGDKKMAEILVEEVAEFEKNKQLFEKMLTIYRAHDLEKLLQFVSESPEYKGFTEVLLNDRNKSWIPVIEKAVTEKPTFFAFGAGHLAGKEGVIALLRKKGFTVKAIN